MVGRGRRAALSVAVLAGLGVGGVGLGALALDRAGLAMRPATVADAIVVLGCGVEEDGTPTPCLAARTDVGIALWKEGRAPVLAFTGGALDGRVAEAGVAAARAHAAGVPTSAMVIEGRSSSTAENAAFTAQLLPRGRLVLVTDTFHLPRAMRCFRAAGYDDLSGAPVVAPFGARARVAVREVAATVWYALRGKCR